MSKINDIVSRLTDSASVKSWADADAQREEAAKHIQELRSALKSALGPLGVLDNDSNMRREVWFDGRVASWTSAAMVEQERKWGMTLRPFGYYPCSRITNKTK